MESIIDGTGSSYEAKVDSKNRLSTFAITEGRIADASKDGDTFVLASDFISLTTTASFNAMMYIKNESDKDLFIQTIRTCSTGSGHMQFRLIRNPTTGTIVSDANDADQFAANFGSNKEFEGLAYSASADGKTITDGDNFTQFTNHSPGHSTEDYRGAVVLPKGSSLGITCKPSVAGEVCLEVVCWFE